MPITELFGRGGECPRCGHHTSVHAFNVMGKTECAGCSSGYCEEEEHPTTIETMGMALIGNMTKNQIIDECAYHLKRRLDERDIDTLRRMLVEVRLEAVKERLIAEAGISPQGGWL